MKPTLLLFTMHIALTACGYAIVSNEDASTIKTIEGLGTLADIATDLETLNR